MLNEISLKPVDFTSIEYHDSLFQSGFWAYFKAHLEKGSQAFIVGYEDKEFPLVIIQRKINNEYCYIYAPRAPQIDLPEELQGFFLESLSKKLISFIPERTVFIRFDTIWETPYTDKSFFTDDMQWKGPPRSTIREIRMNYFTKEKRIRKAPGDHLPTDTVHIDLTENEDKIFSRMRPNTRNSIRRAYRQDVTVKTCSEEYLPDWYSLYFETAQRKGFKAHEYNYFSRLIRSKNNFKRKVNDQSIVPEFKLLMAFSQKDLLAGMILGIYGNYSYYLFAGSSLIKREYMPNYKLQWKAIETAKGSNCRTYDLFGIPPYRDPNHVQSGLYTFKTGLGGEIIHYRGCWDYPLIDYEYAIVRNREITLQ